MYKLIDPQNISKRSFTTNKKFTVTNNDSASLGNFAIRAISSSHHNYATSSDTVTHIVSGSISSSYYALPTYSVIRKLYYEDIHKRFNTKKLQKTELSNSNINAGDKKNEIDQVIKDLNDHKSNLQKTQKF